MTTNETGIVFEEVKPMGKIEYSTIELNRIESQKDLYKPTKTKLTKKQMKARAKSKRARHARRMNRKK